MATSFGYAEIIALSQTGIQAADQAFFEGSACLVKASFFDDEGNPYLPSHLNYQLNDLLSGNNLLPWTYLAPSPTNTVTVTSLQNSMVNQTRESETHQVLFQITDQNGSVFYESGDFEIVRV